MKILEMSRWDGFPKYLKELGCIKGAEIGVEKGNFSKCLCEHGFKMISIDSWEVGHEFEQQAREQLKGLDCKIIKKRSLEAAKDVEDLSLDFVFIDANHDYEPCMEDICAWEPKVRAGGVVSGHDFLDDYGVKKAVLEWVGFKKIPELFVLKETLGNPSWFYVKS